MSDPAAARLFRRSLTARLTSLVALLLFGAGVALRAAAGDYGTGFVVVTALAFAALAGSISAWGDRFRFDDDGVTWENVLLLALASGRGGLGRRRLAWRDVARVQAHGSALFLAPYRGRRMALDAIEDPETVRRLVGAAVAAASAERADAPPALNSPPADRPR